MFIHDKKEWAVFKFNENDEITYCKFSLKGVRKSAIMIDMINPTNEMCEFIKYNNAPQPEPYIFNHAKALDFVINHPDLEFGIPINIYKTFMRLCEGDPVYVMLSIFSRSIVKTNVTVYFLLKKISPSCDKTSRNERRQ